MATRRSFGGIRKLPSGRYQAYYAGPNGVRHTAPDTFATRKEADDFLSDTRAAIRDATWRDPSLAGQNFEVFALWWLTHHDGLRASTRALYANQLDNHILPTLGAFPLRAVSPVVIRDWYTALGAATGPTARAQSYRLVRAIFNEAIRAGALVTNPCNIRGAGTAKSSERVPATLGEIEAIASAMPKRYAMLVQVAAWGGLRAGEALELRRKDIGQDGECPTVSVTRAVVSIAGKNVVSDPKTDAGTRTVHLPPHLREPLARHLARNVGDSPDALVFGTSTGQHLGRSSLSKMFRRSASGVGRADLRFHDLRHTGATLAAQAGATTKELMARIGHASPRAAMIYQHRAAERDQAIARALSTAASASGNEGEPTGARVIPLRRAARGGE